MDFVVFHDRRHAGRVLARQLAAYAQRPDVLVLALPRGGVPVGFEVAQALQAPLDVCLVRKLGAPGHEELAIGAIADGGACVLRRHTIQQLGLSSADVDGVTQRERHELQRRERLYRGTRAAAGVQGRVAIVVDDGLATGATMRAAVMALRARQPQRVVVAVPVASLEACELLRRQADEVVCASTPQPFHAVGLWYDDFSQTTDEAVRALLEQAWHGTTRPAGAPAR